MAGKNMIVVRNLRIQMTDRILQRMVFLHKENLKKVLSGQNKSMTIEIV